MYFSFFLENEIALPLDKGGNLQKVPLIKGRAISMSIKGE